MRNEEVFTNRGVPQDMRTAAFIESPATPERELAVAVIQSALSEISGRPPVTPEGIKSREDAKEFFADGRLDFWAAMTTRSADEWREAMKEVVRLGNWQAPSGVTPRRTVVA